jgi:hypothetical protein
VGFMNNEVKMTLNRTNNHWLQKDNFEPIEDVAH